MPPGGPGPARHYAVLLFADFGHIAPTLGVTRELIARGHRVTYVVDGRFAAIVEETGARAVTYTSARGDFYRAADPSNERLAREGMDLFSDTMRTVFPATLEAFAGDPPDVVLYDFETFAAARVAARLLGAVPVQVSPSHAANASFSLRASMLDAHHPLLVHGTNMLIDFLGEHGIGVDELARYGAEWDDHNLVFLPRAFQIAGETFDDRFAFVGPTFAEPAPGRWTPPADGRRIALVSLGTESGDRAGFFRLCSRAFDPAGWHIVMTLGRGTDPAILGPLPGHVEAHPWLPHPAVLPHADVFVCHAGMGSLMEALAYGTPVVALPYAHELALSAERLEQCGVGRVLDKADPDAEDLAAVVAELLADPDGPAARAGMREAVRTAGGAVRAADLLETWAVDAATGGVSTATSLTR